MTSCFADASICWQCLLRHYGGSERGPTRAKRNVTKTSREELDALFKRSSPSPIRAETARRHREGSTERRPHRATFPAGDQRLLSVLKMGADQSHQDKNPDKDKQQEEQDQGSSAPVDSPDRPGDLPQCLLGNRTVDDMRFMITCTNWY